ncbi:hypothetical protein [Lancefieldella sp. Marseille-Q7238]|uniref:hypothetical protein n=1 Tax=Lancefieldella sp. Marseille-Q7238 TaxID=3022127 RepID=UPI0024A90F88|nr:hypothetical protein [Lancefieldella sp. Marseille-Q7238]
MDSITSELASYLFEAVYEDDHKRVFDICTNENFLKTDYCLLLFSANNDESYTQFPGVFNAHEGNIRVVNIFKGDRFKILSPKVLDDVINNPAGESEVGLCLDFDDQIVRKITSAYMTGKHLNGFEEIRKFISKYGYCGETWLPRPYMQEEFSKEWVKEEVKEQIKKIWSAWGRLKDLNKAEFDSLHFDGSDCLDTFGSAGVDFVKPREVSIAAPIQNHFDIAFLLILRTINLLINRCKSEKEALEKLYSYSRTKINVLAELEILACFAIIRNNLSNKKKKGFFGKIEKVVSGAKQVSLDKKQSCLDNIVHEARNLAYDITHFRMCFLETAYESTPGGKDKKPRALFHSLLTEDQGLADLAESLQVKAFLFFPEYEYYPLFQTPLGFMLRGFGIQLQEKTSDRIPDFHVLAESAIREISESLDSIAG